jgi:hypothetical protein
MTFKALLVAVLASSVAFAAPLTAAEREAKEVRLVEIYKANLHSKAPPPDAAALKAELQGLLFALAGVDPATATAEDGKKLAEVQGEVLKRRDPVLAAEMLRETQRYLCRSKQIDAKVGLKSLARSEEAWKADHARYTAKLAELESVGVSVADFGKRYEFKLGKADAKHFAATATGTGDQAGDVWEVDEKGEPTNSKNLCEQLAAKP